MIKNLFKQITRLARSSCDYTIQKPLNTLFLLLGTIVVAQVIRMAIWANDFPDWVGFGAYNETIQGVRAKTLWDWMELLIVPTTLALGAFLLNRWQTENERKITLDNQRQAMLESYFDKMSELLLSYRLGEVNEEAVTVVARIRTLSLLRQLDGDRKGEALQFMYESGLIFRTKSTSINLLGADLTGAILKGATLDLANLSGTNCSHSNLKYATLREAEMTGVIFDNADLQECDFSGANLRSANFRNANLHGAIFSDADLTESDFLGARVHSSALKKAKALTHAIMPEGVSNDDANKNKTDSYDSNGYM